MLVFDMTNVVRNYMKNYEHHYWLEEAIETFEISYEENEPQKWDAILAHRMEDAMESSREDQPELDPPWCEVVKEASEHVCYLTLAKEYTMRVLGKVKELYPEKF